jgi:hypothetical protein
LKSRVNEIRDSSLFVLCAFYTIQERCLYPGFLNSIRGTFAYAKLGGAAPGGIAALLSGGRPAPSPGAKPLQM